MDFYKQYEQEQQDRLVAEEKCARLEASIATQDAALLAMREALGTAKDAMDERRSYVNSGNAATSWQEMKYGEEWDAEDAQVATAIASTAPAAQEAERRILERAWERYEEWATANREGSAKAAILGTEGKR